MVDPDVQARTAEAAGWLLGLAKLAADDGFGSPAVIWLTRMAAICPDVPVRDWSGDSVIDPEVLYRTVEACAWLYPIAEECVASHAWSPALVRWFDSIGAASHELFSKGLQ